jgi:hypothetical protein
MSWGLPLGSGQPCRFVAPKITHLVTAQKLKARVHSDLPPPPLPSTPNEPERGVASILAPIRSLFDLLRVSILTLSSSFLERSARQPLGLLPLGPDRSIRVANTAHNNSTMATQQMLIADTVAGMKKALKRKAYGTATVFSLYHLRPALTNSDCRIRFRRVQRPLWEPRPQTTKES